MIEFDRSWKYMEEDINGGFEGCSTDFESLITITRPYDISVSDLDKRTHALLDVLNCPKANKRYVQNMAIGFMNKCAKAGRTDLVTIIQEAMI